MNETNYYTVLSNGQRHLPSISEDNSPKKAHLKNKMN